MTKAQREVRAIKRGVAQAFMREVRRIFNGLFCETLHIGRAFTRAGR